MRHKHADLIIAWANGAQIERKVYSEWLICIKPDWDVLGEYRIKPQDITEMWTIKEGIIVKAVWNSDKTKLISVELVK